MPHTNHTSNTSSSGDDLGSTDEVKVFKDEGDREDEKISSENLLEEKSSLIDLTESEDTSGKSSSRPDHSPVYGKLDSHNHTSSFNMGYLVSPYTYPNGAPAGLPVSMANKMGLSPFFCHNGDHLTTPPPAHCGIPPYQLDPKAIGLSRPAIYPFSGQYPYPILSPDMSGMAASWHTPSLYSPGSGFRSPYSSSLPINTTLSSDFYRFSPNNLLPSVHSHHVHSLNSHSSIIGSGVNNKESTHDSSNHRYGRSNSDQKNSSGAIQSDSKDSISNEKKKPHIKKPLNAFMLYMKEMRAKVVAECTLKESAAINQILGRKWHALGREEQAKYYELARRERQLHMQMYPDWSSRANTQRGKKRKRKQESNDGGNNMKKCRARYGLDQQSQWCKPCRRKKKCIRYKEVDQNNEESIDMDNHHSDDNLGSCGSVDDAKTPDDDCESLNQSMSSPGCLSGLSSLQSPSTSLASPLNLLASPSTPIAFHEQQQQQLAHEAAQNHINNMKKAAAALGMTNGDVVIKTETEFNQKRDNPKMMPEDECSRSNKQPLNNVPEKQKPPDMSSSSSASLFYDKLALIKPPSTAASSLSANLRDNPQHPQHPLNINQLTRRDYSSNGSPIMQRKGAPTPTSGFSPFNSPFPPSPPNQYLHRQFLADNYNSLQSHHTAHALHNLHLQSSLNAHAIFSAAGNSAMVQRAAGTGVSNQRGDNPNAAAATTDNSAISVT
ncbi:protein pangolin, isoforms A/H/I/S isoform X2 [Culicoides brevitarsis]|uniref:protein pangolin, isoforms A/H/I/S isoform X2 n=1 Tax=Culicoides brevitarsis TaxID=469753 RepID=UPI00307BE860